MDVLSLLTCRYEVFQPHRSHARLITIVTEAIVDDTLQPIRTVNSVLNTGCHWYGCMTLVDASEVGFARPMPVMTCVRLPYCTSRHLWRFERRTAVRRPAPRHYSTFDVILAACATRTIGGLACSRSEQTIARTTGRYSGTSGAPHVACGSCQQSPQQHCSTADDAIAGCVA